MGTKKIETLHSEHRVWLNKLQFYKDDIEILKHRIEEIAAKNSKTEILAHVEHFQNQFIIQRNEIDEFRHEIKQHENVIEKEIAKNEVAINRRSLEDHPEMRERMERFEKLFQELRKELMRFLSKTM